MPKYTLGEVSVEVKETYKGDKTGIPIVGLEHLTPGEVTLTSWDQDTENSFTKTFDKGDVLFGRRRAYLKKAALAPFKGICSGDITVIRANPKFLSPSLFPFLIQHDALFSFAVGKSAGSLSPRVKWEHLKTYEIVLPPLEEQEKTAKVLWAIEDTCQAYKKLFNETDALVKAEYDRLVADNKDRTVKLQDLLNQNKKKERITDTKCEKYISVALYGKGISERDIGEDDVKAFTATRVHKGQFVYCRIWLRKGAAGIVPEELEGAVVSNEFPSFDIQKDRIRPAFLMYSVLDDNFLTKIGDGSKGSTSKQRIKEEVFLNYSIVLPSLEEQERFDNFVEHSNKSKAVLQQAINEARALQKKIVEDCFTVHGKEN